MPKIFISYRREDSQYQADRLHAVLKKHVPRPNQNIFIDIDNIPVGVDFVEHLDTQVAQCDVLLALIGPDWLEIRNPTTGKRRIDDPKDFVRIEIGSALRRGIQVAPLLLDGTPFPTEESLPDDLKPLVRRNGVELRRTSFDADAERLVRGLALKTGPAPVIQKAKAPTTATRSPQKASGSSSNVIVLSALALIGATGGGIWYFTSSSAKTADGQLAASTPATTAALPQPEPAKVSAVQPSKSGQKASTAGSRSSTATSEPAAKLAKPANDAATAPAAADPRPASAETSPSTPKTPDRSATMITRPDQSIIRTAMDTVKKTGECNAEYVVGADGKAKNIKPNCTINDYDRYVIEYIGTARYEPAIEDGIVVEATGRTGLIQFQGPALPAEKGPVLVTAMPTSKEIANALKGVSGGAICTLSYTVGTNGIPSDIVSTCNPEKLNASVTKAAREMRFQPGQRDGRAVAWPVKGHQFSFGSQSAVDRNANAYQNDPTVAIQPMPAVR